MTELTALTKHACAACGAQAEWNPARTALICPYCGTESPAELDAATGRIQEIDLVRTLREMPPELRGWQAERRSVRCRSCQAVSVFAAEHVGRSCDFCGSTQLVNYEELKPPIRPQSVLPFGVAAGDVRRAIRRWFAGKWLAPGPFRRRASLDTVHGLYLPYWTFDARVTCPWTAESGTYYYTSESFRDSSGRRRTRRVRHVRWRPAAGEVQHVFDDVPVPGSRGADAALLAGIEPFPLGQLAPYDTGYLAGFVVEHYQVVLIDAAKRAREAMHEHLLRLCAAQIPGDTHRNLQIDPRYDGETFKHVLLPVWIAAYRYGDRVYQVLVNGSTGKVAGRYPKSVWKILLLVLAALLVAGTIAFVSR